MRAKRTAGGHGRQVLAAAAAVALGVSLLPLSPMAGTIPGLDIAPAAADGTVTIEVTDRETGLPVENFRYLINDDIAHENPSVTPPASYSPVAATGTHVAGEGPETVDLPDGRYLLTVDGGAFPESLAGEFPPAEYKLWGEHFEVAGGSLTVPVALVPNPLPTATLRVRVFHDNNLVNGEDDIPLEQGLEGFAVHIADPVGEVVVDFYGNPVCTQYDGDPAGAFPPGNPIPGTGGACHSDASGHAVIPNLPPGRYEVEVIPPDGSGWRQTTTIEGTHHIDAWLEEGADGFSTEEGFLQDVVWFGFVRDCAFGDAGDGCPTNDAAGTGSVSGTVRTIGLDTEGPIFELGDTVPSPLLALNNIGGDDEQIWTGQGNPDGTFTIPNVPEGLYQLVVWDAFLDYIIQFRTVRVGAGQNVAMGDIGVPRWFGTIEGYSYIDSGRARNGTVITASNSPLPPEFTAPPPMLAAQGNQVRDCYDPDGAAPFTIDPRNVATCEPGLPGQDLDVRHKDGSLQYATFADTNGRYAFPEYFEWEHFLTWEVGYGRFRQEGTAGYATDFGGEPVGYPYAPVHRTDPGLAALLSPQITAAGTTTWIDTGKQPHRPGENGGITGVVYYAVTRNEFDPRLAAAEDYETGIPGVAVNLYEASLDAGGNPVVEPDGSLARGALVDSATTDDWSQNLPGPCDPPDLHGVVIPPEDPCIELPRTFNQMDSGVFDGGYAFEGMPAGQYIVEVVAPEGYEVIAEEHQNTDQGDDFVPQVPPPPCAGPLHLVEDPRNPADGQTTPLCTEKLVEVLNGANPAADFFLMTDNQVPPPGLLRGLLIDDLTVETNPASPLYVEKRGLPNTPVGILDFEGNEIERVYTDENGYFEVLLPSTHTALCPIPSGICPGMYQVIGNYPGSPDDPVPDDRWNPNYDTLRLVFDIWPGKTTYADVAVMPITGFVQGPGPNFDTPPECSVDAGEPDVQSVSQPYGGSSTSGTFTIDGAGFGDAAGTLTLGGTGVPVVSWSDTSIEVAFSALAGVPAGPQQLLVTTATGRPGTTGITFHVLGAGYDPPLVHVDEANTGPEDGTTPATAWSSVQEGLDAATDGDLVIVHPGTYFENVIVDENIKVQGHGPGATVLDGRFFNFGGTTPEEFQAKLATLAYDGPETVPMAQVVTIVAEDGELGAGGFAAQLDGLAIRGGRRVRGNVAVPAQGGGVYAHAFARDMVVSNNLLQNNAGAAGSAVVFGQAYTPNPDAAGAEDNQNDGARILHNRILNNGGTRLAGAIGLFNGADGYVIADNVICGNYSAEYGAGVSHFGLSPGGALRDNAVLFNSAFDEGGGVMLAGQQSPDPGGLSPGAGDVTVERNRIQGNLSNDDGGGIRLLQPVAGPVTIQNNMVVNNLATDHGGGISVDDALDVRIVANTVAKNVSTATAEDALAGDLTPPPPDGFDTVAQAAGLSTEPHSDALLGTSPPTTFSNPVLFDNVFWENSAFHLDGFGNLVPAPPGDFIDLQVVNSPTPLCLDPRASILTVDYQGAECAEHPSNQVGADPSFAEEVDTDFIAVAFAGDPSFVTILIRSTPDDPQGDYHVQPASPAIDAGIAALGGSGGGLETLLSLADNSPLAGVAPRNEDLFSWNGSAFSLVFDGSDVGVTGDVDAAERLDDDELLFSLVGPATLPGIGAVDDSDLVRFTATSLGTTTAGTFSMYFDGSDVGLTTGGEDVDGVELLADGRLLVSTQDAVTVPGLTAANEDLLALTPAPGGLGDASTAGTWALWFDGSAHGLAAGSEDVDAADLFGNGLYLSTRGPFSVPGRSGANEDVFVCTPTITGGVVTACTWSPTLHFDGSTFGLAGNNVDAAGITAVPPVGGVTAPADDFDRDPRPLDGPDADLDPEFDIGADEFR